MSRRNRDLNYKWLNFDGLSLYIDDIKEIYISQNETKNPMVAEPTV